MKSRHMAKCMWRDAMPISEPFSYDRNGKVFSGMRYTREFKPTMWQSAERQLRGRK